MKNLYKKSMFLMYAILVFFVPILFTPFTQEAFEFPKITLIYVLGTLIFSLFLLFNKKLQFRHFNLVIPLLVIYIVSTLFSLDVYTSIWGYYSRFMGLIAFIFFVFLSYISSEIFSKDDFYKLFTLSLFSTFLVSLYGIFQYSHVERIYSTIGQPNWLAQYLLLSIPLIVYLYVSKKFSFSKPFYIILLILYTSVFMSFWLSFSLSGFLGLFISLFFFPKGDTKRYMHLLLISLVIIFTNFSFFSARVNDTYIDVKRFITESFTVYAEDSYLISDPGFIRKEVWKGTINIFLASPKNMLFGIGPQTFPYVFPFYRNALLNYSSEWDYIINRPHNYYLELLVELGIFGLLAYLYLISSVFKKSPDYLKPVFIGFFITNIFGWPVTSTSLVFWLLVGYINLKSLSKDSGGSS